MLPNRCNDWGVAALESRSPGVKIPYMCSYSFAAAIDSSCYRLPTPMLAMFAFEFNSHKEEA